MLCCYFNFGHSFCIFFRYVFLPIWSQNTNWSIDGSMQPIFSVSVWSWKFILLQIHKTSHNHLKKKRKTSSWIAMHLFIGKLKIATLFFGRLFWSKNWKPNLFFVLVFKVTLFPDVSWCDLAQTTKLLIMKCEWKSFRKWNWNYLKNSNGRKWQSVFFFLCKIH